MLLRRCFGINKSNDDENDNRLNCNIYHLVRRLKISKEKFKFEYLPNELIFIIFEYLYYHDIIYSFHQLNSRFQSLLYSYQYYHLNISYLTRFNYIQQFLFNIQHIKSLTLSNNNNFYINIELFYPKLQSLSLINIDNNQLISFIFFLPNFQQLKYLSISKRGFYIEKQIFHIILFQIKTLKYFNWDVNSSFFYGINKTSFLQKSTIKHYGFYYIHFSNLVWLKSHTITMKSLHIYYPSFWCNSSYEQQTFERLTSIKLNNICTLDNIEFLFEHLICLNHLNQLEFQGDFIRLEYYIDGYKWEYFIRKYIPQLKIFRFFFILSKWSMIRTIDEFLEPFKNDFWLKDKKWFITCDYRALFDRTYIYTIPYMNNDLKYSILCQRKSTIIIKNDILNLRQLSLDSIKTQDILLNNRFINIQSLIVNKIDDDVTYEQLNSFLNISSIKHIEFQSRIHSKLFFHILKYNIIKISIEIDYDDLREILRREIYHNHYLKKIKQLTLTYRKGWSYKTYIPLTMKQIKNLCYYFSNIEQLTIKGAVELGELIYLLNQLKHLSFLMVTCYSLSEIGNDNIRQWLINQQKIKLNEKNFIFKWSEDIFYIWID